MASDIGDFLRAKRERLTPDDCGLPSSGQRRVLGLRREEVALLSGVSPDYYVRLEQGRARSVSVQVLNAIARALRLDSIETEHLHRLAHPDRLASESSRRSPRAGVLALLDAMTDVPAFVLNSSLDVIAANLLGHTLSPSTIEHETNLARHLFLDARSRTFYPEWDKVARETAAHIRRTAGQRPGDHKLHGLIGELTIRSPDFVQLWARQEVLAKTYGSKIIRHPTVGRLEFSYETLSLPEEPDLMLVTYTPSDERTRGALTTIGS